MNNQTLNRLYKQDGNILVNPFLERPVGLNTGFHRADNERWASVKKELLETQGWQLFGNVGGGGLSANEDGVRFDPADDTPNPFLSAAGRSANGLKVFGGRGYVTGLIQKIRGGKSLVGRRVKISGCYNVADDSGVAAGVSIWLKGRVHQISAAASPVLSGTGSTPGSGGFQLDDVGQGFDINTQQGDTLLLKSQTTGFSTPHRGLFTIDHSTTPPTNDAVYTPVNSHFLPGIEASLVYNISRGNSCLDGFGVRIDHGTTIPGYVAHLTVAGGVYTSENLVNPVFDNLVPVNLDLNTPNPALDSASVYMFGNQVTNRLLNASVRNAGYWEDAGYNGGFELWVIDAEEWTDSAPDGNILLHQEITAVDATAHYFEEIIEIPATFLTDEDDMWIIVLPGDPRTQLAVGGGGIETNIYSVTLELLPEDADDGGGIAGRLLKGFNNNLLVGVGGAASRMNEAVRDPALIPMRYHLPMNMAIPASPGVTTGYHRFGGSSGPGGYPSAPGFGPPASGTLALLGDGIGTWSQDEFWVPVPLIPNNAIITSWSFRLEALDFIGLEIHARLWQVYSDYPGDPVGGEYQRRLISQGRSNYSFARNIIGPSEAADMSTDLYFVLRRNRLGLFVGANGVDSPDYNLAGNIGGQVWAELVFDASSAVPGATPEVFVHPGFVDAYVDPRTAGMRWVP